MLYLVKVFLNGVNISNSQLDVLFQHLNFEAKQILVDSNY